MQTVVTNVTMEIKPPTRKGKETKRKQTSCSPWSKGMTRKR